MQHSITITQIAIIIAILIIIYLVFFNSKQINKNNTLTLYYFYSPSCGHCKKFEPTWNSLVSNNSIKFNKINGSDINNKDILFYYSVVGFPTLILQTQNKFYEYKGNRTYDNIIDFIRKHS
jgi:thiol-disulfide isomerase/thioredoxin